ncbi:TonB family protein [Catenovulum agarivorans DS-2]|uniref:Protein TonB n=1 Tax=Catenovulum agarivorans DS-2 TaxID=1328313 RepID=W7QHA0_9ALTE|nr:energy transducer TonB [Catenovulum agarivorans]EWH12324.1 TonB family protein [Catenovulum agarivorans DS-2]
MKIFVLLLTSTLSFASLTANAKVYLASELTADVQPIVRVAPRYPAKAARNGVIGHVALKFVINEYGAVTNVEVTESMPEGVFDREAIKAVSKWKYKPAIIDGAPVKVMQETRLDFSLGK